MFDLVSSVRRTFAAKLRGHGFKLWPGAVGCLVTIIMWEGLARLKTGFELNPVTEGKQWTLPFLFCARHFSLMHWGQATQETLTQHPPNDSDHECLYIHI